ncbi:zinc finger BED domain-containing protein RICESLEEPER 3-like [Setaria viridis]|uniref:zinc finger BED domain-containing protein RICESLEEPER 3-like n=1 Tax=Setaria viridis TaxID=4556 RepID=UPI00149333FE|nr:uncharacterized protein LOC117861418 [Setaria viridis]XP_034600867.1 uncharacterized protein LOC117861418 [Setaria viridis]
MIATHGYEVVEEFMCFVRCLDPDFKLPSREDMEKMWDGILDKERTQLLSSLTREGAKPGRVSFILGTVATIEPGGEATLYTACNFIDGDWNLHRVVADAYMVSELTRDVPDIPNHGFLDNMFMMVGHEDDNIPSSLTDHYGKLLPACPLNQKLLRSTTYIYMDRVLHSVARCLLPCEMSIQTNLLGLSTGQEDPRAYNEQWYSLYCFLKILQDDHSTTTTEATELIGLLCRLWGSIHESIQMISDSTRPTSNLCLAELLNLRKKFQAELTSSPTEEYTGVSYGKTVKDVLRQALKIIDKTIDHSYLVWSIPCILDPRRKLFFERNGKSFAVNFIRREKKEKGTSLYNRQYLIYCRPNSTKTTTPKQTRQLNSLKTEERKQETVLHSGVSFTSFIFSLTRVIEPARCSTTDLLVLV